MVQEGQLGGASDKSLAARQQKKYSTKAFALLSLLAMPCCVQVDLDASHQHLLGCLAARPASGTRPSVLLRPERPDHLCLWQRQQRGRGRRVLSHPQGPGGGYRQHPGQPALPSELLRRASQPPFRGSCGRRPCGFGAAAHQPAVQPQGRIPHKQLRPAVGRASGGISKVRV